MSDTRFNPIKELSTKDSIPSAKLCSVTEKSNKEIYDSARGLEGTQTIDCCRPSSPSWSTLHSWDARMSSLMSNISHDASSTRGHAFAPAQNQQHNLFFILSLLKYGDAQWMCDSNRKLVSVYGLCADGCYLLM